jgi:hypothetical protein
MFGDFIASVQIDDSYIPTEEDIAELNAYYDEEDKEFYEIPQE